jgi:hypothetical protein
VEEVKRRKQRREREDAGRGYPGSNGGQVRQYRSYGIAGQGIDVYGGAVVDPTENVQALSNAISKRQDDLRLYSERLVMGEISHVKHMSELRSAHSKELRIAEANRLDSIRQVDVTAVRTEANRALEAIQTLAATTARDAETLRTALVNTATTIATSTANTFAGLAERVAALEKSSYEGQGKQAVVDPQIVELITEMRRSVASRNTNAGERQGISLSWAVMLAVAGLAGGLLMSYLRTPAAQYPYYQQQYPYVPAPSGTMLPSQPPTAPAQR